MLIRTQHSSYDIDLRARVLRRLDEGLKPSEWKAYDSLTPKTPEVGCSVFIDYGDGRGTMTGLITEVVRDA